jgi:hypothetical protein
MIGGNVATNAGGLRYIKYGSLHGNTVGYFELCLSFIVKRHEMRNS